MAADDRVADLGQFLTTLAQASGIGDAHAGRLGALDRKRTRKGSSEPDRGEQSWSDQEDARR